MVAGFIDVAATVHAIVKPIVGETKVYAHGPLPDFGDNMVVYQVVAPRPVGHQELEFAAVRANIMFQVFDRDRVKAAQLANKVCREFYARARSREPVMVGVDESYRVSYVQVDTFPTQVNANLVNDRLVYRYDFELQVIVRHV